LPEKTSFVQGEKKKEEKTEDRRQKTRNAGVQESDLAEGTAGAVSAAGDN
jgi:hypothetical protein